MSELIVTGTVRSEVGKGAARRLRANNMVPGVVYGGKGATTIIAVSPKELTAALMTPKRRNVLITLKLKNGAKDETRAVMLKEVQVHPLRRHATHVDLLEVDPNSPVTAKVPFEVIGKTKATTNGALMRLVLNRLTISAKPAALPEKIVFDITGTDQPLIRAKELTMPAGVTLLEAEETPVISVRMPRGGKEDEAAPAAAAAAPAAAPAKAGAAAAPAAAPAKDAKKK